MQPRDIREDTEEINPHTLLIIYTLRSFHYVDPLLTAALQSGSFKSHMPLCSCYSLQTGSSSHFLRNNWLFVNGIALERESS